MPWLGHGLVVEALRAPRSGVVVSSLTFGSALLRGFAWANAARLDVVGAGVRAAADGERRLPELSSINGLLVSLFFRRAAINFFPYPRLSLLLYDLFISSNDKCSAHPSWLHQLFRNLQIGYLSR